MTNHNNNKNRTERKGETKKCDFLFLLAFFGLRASCRFDDYIQFNIQ